MILAHFAKRLHGFYCFRFKQHLSGYAMMHITTTLNEVNYLHKIASIVIAVY